MPDPVKLETVRTWLEVAVWVEHPETCHDSPTILTTAFDAETETVKLRAWCHCNAARVVRVQLDDEKELG